MKKILTGVSIIALIFAVLIYSKRTSINPQPVVSVNAETITTNEFASASVTLAPTIGTGITKPGQTNNHNH